MITPVDVLDKVQDQEAQSKMSKEIAEEDSVSVADSLSTYPEGGKEATLTLIGAFLASLVQFGVVNLVGVLQVQYSAEQLKGMSESKISWIGTILLFFYFFTAAFVGRCFDAYGPTVLVISGTLLTVFGLMVSLCKTYYQLALAEGVVLGVGTSVIFYPALSAIAHWYNKKRASAMGIVTAGSSVGAVVFPIALNNLIPAVGFPWAVRIMGFMVLVLMIPSCVLIKARLPRREFGSVADVIDLQGFKDVRYVLCILGGMIPGLGLYNPYFYSQTFAVAKGYSSNISFYIVAIMNAGSLFGRIIPGLVADRFGALNLMAFSSIIAALVLLCWMAVSSPAGFVVWATIYGFWSGTFLSLSPACIAALTSDMSAYGGRTGLFFAMISFMVLVSAPAGGALLDNDGGSFDHLIVFSGIAYFVGAAFFLASRLAADRRLFVRF